eukprot:TRINITY_DN5506_c0_g1_i1.p1 TRINITY_DN5506_c0_g1~~TRINITY_DN5506_c0_g1_i1.p1  ORF type:complete len:108 (+),score=12.99 TRINITY_DN5506_c0_g1_i1:342-665(+)
MDNALPHAANQSKTGIVEKARYDTAQRAHVLSDVAHHGRRVQQFNEILHQHNIHLLDRFVANVHYFWGRMNAILVKVLSDIFFRARLLENALCSLYESLASYGRRIQ